MTGLAGSVTPTMHAAGSARIRSTPASDISSSSNRIVTRVGKLSLFPRLLIATVGGGIRRYVRRILGRPPRIWHGMFPLHAVNDMVQSDRIAGFPSRSVVRAATLGTYALVRAEEFDRVVSDEGWAWHEWNWVCLIDLLWNGDIWIAFFECLFFRPDQESANRIVFRLLETVGIRIVVAPHGGDVAHLHRYRSRFDWIERYQQDYPEWNFRAEQIRAEQKIRLFCRYADFVVAPDSALMRFLPRKDLYFKYFPVDCARLKPAQRVPPATPRVVHAPNHRFVKGTDCLMAAVESLARKGIRAEVQLIEKVPRHEAVQLYREADVIADQFIIGAFGVLALEGMALGKPVLTYLDQEHLGDPVFNHPLVNANPDNLQGVLAVLLLVRELRERIGKASRESVEKYQSIEALAEVWGRIYKHVWWGKPLDLESTHHFDSVRGTRSFTEDPARPEFWPVPVDDLLPEIHEALAQAGFPVLNVARTVSA